VSLINKMLKDLETRAPRAAGRATVKPIFSDLQPAEARAGARPRGPMLGIAAVLVLAAAAVLWWLWPAAPLVTAVAVHPVPPAPPPVAPAVEPAPPPAAVPAPPIASPPPVASRGEPAPAKPRVSRPRPPAAPPAKTAEADGAREVAAGRIEKTPVPLSAADQAENAYREALRLLGERRRGEAEAALVRALAADTRHDKARELLVGIMLEQGRGAEARAVLEEGVAANPERSMSYRYLARLQVERGAEAEALALLEGAPAGVRQDPEVAALLAAVYQRGGRHADAIQAFRSALGARPREGRWWVGLAISCEAEQQWAAARDAYERAGAASLDPRLREYSEQRLAALKNR